MASLYVRGNLLWLRIKENGKWKSIPTGLHQDNLLELRQAQKRRAEYEVKEFTSAPAERVNAGWQWVTEYLELTYQTRPATLERYSDAWATLRLYLEEKKIETPARLLREHCQKYLTWRKVPDFKAGKYRAGHNTALLELKILRIVMNEAVIRGYCTGNPCVKLNLQKLPQRKAPELSNDQIELVRARIAAEPAGAVREFLSISLEIARWQGCRVSETRLNPQTDVEIATVAGVKRGTIRFVGKGQREIVTMLHPQLIPVFEKLQAAGRSSTWDPPAGAGRTWPSTVWTRFLQRSGLKEQIGQTLCFRSLRVTVITRMARNNVPLSKSMEYVKHASTTQHRVYQRLKTADLDGCADAIL